MQFSMVSIVVPLPDNRFILFILEACSKRNWKTPGFLCQELVSPLSSGSVSRGPLRPQAAEWLDGELFQRPAACGGHRPGPQRHLTDHPLSDQRHGEYVFLRLGAHHTVEAQRHKWEK